MNQNYFNIYNAINEIHNGIYNSNRNDLFDNVRNCLDRINNLYINDLNSVQNRLNNLNIYKNSYDRLYFLNQYFYNNNVLNDNELNEIVNCVNNLLTHINLEIDNLIDHQNNINNNINNNGNIVVMID